MYKTRMKMKRTTTLLLCGTVMLALFQGCDAILDVEPKTFTGTTNYYQTPAQFERALAGAYSYLQDLNAGAPQGRMWALVEMRSDNTTYQYFDANRGQLQTENIDDFLLQAANTRLEFFWSTTYEAIAQTNVILDRIQGVDFDDEAAKNRVIGEAEFLRAYHYFNLVRLFGGVPLILHEVKTPVYDQILADVRDAAEKLTPTAPAPGRATKGAASMLLADVLLTRKDYQGAIAALRDVQSMGYSLLSSYEDVFDPNNKNHAESIFEVQFAAGVEGEFSGYAYQFGPRNAGCAVIPGPCQGGDLGGWNIPTFDMVAAYEPGDLRKDASIGFYEAEDSPEWSDVAIGDTIPYVKKYIHPFDTINRTDDNWPVYRYADALLFLAEALNEVGQTGEAYAPLNEVRQRAGLDPLSGLAQDQFRDAVLHEQRVEQAFENKRWFQLLRTGRTLEVMNEHLRLMRERVPTSRIPADVEPYKLLYAIPEQEVRLNELEQNPGW